MEQFQQSLQRLHESISVKREEKAKLVSEMAHRFSGTLPKRCELHPDVPLEFSAELTAAAAKNAPSLEPEPRFERCPECADELALVPLYKAARRAGVPDAFFFEEDPNFDGLEAKDIAQFAKNPSGFLLLVGPPGCGKTHSAAAIAVARLRRGEQVLFVTHGEMVERHRATYRDPSAEDIKRRAIAAKLLVVDEAGRAPGGNDAATLLFEVLNARYADNRATILTTNSSTAELRDKLGDALVSRINGALAAVVNFSGPDLRGTGDDGREQRLALVARLLAHIKGRAAW